MKHPIGCTLVSGFPGITGCTGFSGSNKRQNNQTRLIRNVRGNYAPISAKIITPGKLRR